MLNLVDPFESRLPGSRRWRGRRSIGFAVIGTFIGATALMAYGVHETVELVEAVVAESSGGVDDVTGAPPLLAGIAAVDTFLIGVVLYFIAVALYQLSFHPLPLPRWLIVDDLGDLEDKLAKVVVLVLGMAFLRQAVT
jgi:uncharacterized membrane protein YqhA